MTNPLMASLQPQLSENPKDHAPGATVRLELGLTAREASTMVLTWGAKGGAEAGAGLCHELKFSAQEIQTHAIATWPYAPVYASAPIVPPRHVEPLRGRAPKHILSIPTGAAGERWRKPDR